MILNCQLYLQLNHYCVVDKDGSRFKQAVISHVAWNSSLHHLALFIGC